MTAALVIDASAALRIVLKGEGGENYGHAARAASLLLAPRLYCTEAANGLWRNVRAGFMSRPDALDKLNRIILLVDRFEDDDRLASETLTLSIELGHPVYDLTYLVLARRNGAGLVTADRGLAELGAKLCLDVIH